MQGYFQTPITSGKALLKKMGGKILMPGREEIKI